MSVKLLTEHRLEFVSLKGGYTGSSESTLVKMPHCVAAQFMIYWLRADAYDTLGAFISQRKRKNSDKYHKSSFFMHALHRFMLEFTEIVCFFYFMQTHEKGTQLGNYVLCGKSAFVCQGHRVLPES